jgi:hypothetical protein
VPKDLTDASQWETVAVPVGTDPATASSVETPFQLLADRTRYLLNRLGAGLLLNWFATDTSTAPTADTGGPLDGVHDPVTGNEVIVDFTGAGLFEDNVAPGGMVWAHGPGGAMGGNIPRLAVDHLGNVVCVPQESSSHNVFFSPTPLGTWVDWTAGLPAGSWVRVAHDWLGRWVIGSATGDILQSTGPGVAFAVVTVDPSFPNAIYCLRHSHHPAELLSPDDPGNQSWVALSPTRASRSADGMTWTAAALHDLSGYPRDIAYSALGTKWIAPLVAPADPGGAFIGLGVSDDNGETWAEVTPFATALGASSITDARIACDGHGGWVVALTDGTGVELWASHDNGVTWTQAYLPSAPHPDQLALWYGGGRFHLMTTDESGAWAGFASLRADE